MTVPGTGDLEARIVAMLAEERGEPVENIRLTTRLFEDLGMDGDDATEFFEDFAKTFQVDLSGIQWSRHFGSEGCFPFIFLCPGCWRWRGRMRPITVAHLISAAETGRWSYNYD